MREGTRIDDATRKAPEKPGPDRDALRRSRPDRDALVEQFLPLIRHVAARLAVPLPSGMDREDLFGAGAIGLIHAASSWDPTRGASFKTFAYTAIRGAMLDELRRIDPVPRPRRDRMRLARRKAVELEKQLGRQPETAELAAVLGISVSELEEDRALLRASRVTSLDELRDPSDQDGGSEATSDPARSPVDLASDRDLVDRVTRAIADLPETERRVVVLYHLEGLYLKEIGVLLGVSESRVCQILGRAQERLRRVVESTAVR
ncbi:MAG: FliA/WhiG family RNA polymerase sigma factor [Planctomycetota bacterium]